VAAALALLGALGVVLGVRAGRRVAPVHPDEREPVQAA
jgi:hypothetical protein